MIQPPASQPPGKPPELIDRATLARHRRRADMPGAADFLHRAAADEIHDRLAEINRTFAQTAVVTGFPDLWRDLVPGAAVVADGDALALPQGLDLVIHAMALHWANDPVGQIIQCARALKPDGLFVAVCPGNETLHELRDAMTQAEIAISGGISPRVLPMGEVRQMGMLLGRAGLALPVADLVSLRTSYRDLNHLVHELRDMGETNALTDRLRRPAPRALFDAAARAYADRHPDPDNPGRVLASFDLVFLTGWAPAATQQQPLRPGTAQMRLSDALNKDDAR